MPRACSPICRVAAVTFGLAAAGRGGGPVAAQAAATDIPISPVAEPAFTVGVAEGAAWEMFGYVSDVAFDADGTLFILDDLAGHIVVIDSAGDFVRTIANKGDGPGELVQPIAIAVLRDGRIAVNDIGKPGIQLFRRDGEFLDGVPFGPVEGMPGSPIYALPDHSLLSPELIGFSASTMTGADEGRPITRFRLDGSRDVFYAAWDDPPPPGFESGEGAPGARIVTSPIEAFTLPLSLGVLRDGRIALADSIGYRIKLLDASGRVTDLLERPLAPVPVTGAIRDAERQRRLEALRSRDGGTASVQQVGGPPGAVSPEARRNAMREALRRTGDRIRDMVFPAEIPVIANVAVDWNDRVWIQRSAPPGETGPTDVLAADGRYLGTIPSDGLRIPEAFGPEGLAAYIERDAFDIQRVRVVRLAVGQPLEEAR
ncbi:6-bladed beta-propeller [Candidatus Palauibacter soopunensis]|uniref:6-bladed beta-propeller n=1 Tax=Candidatus Palauibacter soopunensis TaxID=3056739 RepID=UPI00238DC41E|nr:6-bladed beta-propeller [Candidatus Palauibacter soopunensis]MDE2879383.1 6-bladed beta-propeller [Candidatus Palauibacter soopunensis]